MACHGGTQGEQWRVIEEGRDNRLGVVSHVTTRGPRTPLKGAKTKHNFHFLPIFIIFREIYCPTLGVELW